MFLVHYPATGVLAVLTCLAALCSKPALRQQQKASAQRPGSQSVSNAPSIAASRLSTASTAVNVQQHHNKNVKETWLSSIAQPQEAEKETRLSSIAQQQEAEQERQDDVLASGCVSHEVNAPPAEVSPPVKGGEEYAVRAQTSAWGSSKLRAHTASQAMQGERLGDWRDGSSHDGRNRMSTSAARAPQTSRGMIGGHKSPSKEAQGTNAPALQVVRKKEWNHEGMRDVAESIQNDVLVLRDCSRGIKVRRNGQYLLSYFATILAC